jgi:hypothetical protein
METIKIRPPHFPKTEKAIRSNFAGKANTGLRKRLREEAYRGEVSDCSDVGLTIWGRESLAEVRRVHRAEMQEQGLADANGYPLYEIGVDEYGRPVAFLDQPMETYSD